MSNKIGFWSVFALVTGSQIGSTILVAPATLAQYGVFSLVGWLISGLGAIALCFVFASLCSRFPQTGGPHTYVNHLFGPAAAFFTGWTYWVVSWVSSTIVVITAVGALSPFLGEVSKFSELAMQISLLLIIGFLNLRGVRAAGRAELVLMLMKFTPLIIIPLAALFYFDVDNFVISSQVSSMPVSSILSKVVLLTFFGFIGLECATTPAGDVNHPKKTIPKAIILGTLLVALLYMFNSVGIMGIMPSAELAQSKAPYVDASKIIFGGNWHFLIALIASITCIGSLNAWVLASSQIVLGLAKDGLMPQIFAKKNQHEAPYFSVIISCAGTIPLLILTTNESLAAQVNSIVDFSVTAFLFVYLACCFALIKLQLKDKESSLPELFCGILSAIFCFWVIYETPIKSLCVAMLFVCSGIPVYFFWVKKHFSK
ncbi:MAG: amino acid permease [Proteobacteria bacterium]|nr:amino acid permease [Pseudomonadota bacterium]